MKLFFDYSFNLFIQHDLKFLVLVMYWNNHVYFLVEVIQ